MKKLRILLVARGVMGHQLGTHKVHIELKEEYEKAGHVVDVLDYSCIYPADEKPYHRIIGPLYTYKFWKYLKKNGHKYDVIDANVECITYPKASFGFMGVLMARSHGIRPVYDKAEKNEAFQKAISNDKKTIKFKTRIGNLYRFIQKKPGYKEFWASVKYADLVHCLNTTEYNYYLQQGVSVDKLLLIPNGLSDKIITRSNQAKKDGLDNTAAFIGSWTIRKGIKDLSLVLDAITKKTNLTTLSLLGGHTKPDKVKEDFTVAQQQLLEITPSYNPDELPQHLQKCKVGFFPSYIEGFPLAVIELLSAGIPIVAYNVPGPDGILQELDETLLIEPGDIKAFANKVISILQLEATDYIALSDKCKQESRKYLLSTIASRFLHVFATRLTSNAI